MKSDTMLGYRICTARQAGLISCSLCHRLDREVMVLARCRRCGQRLEQRNSKLSHCWLLLLLALLAYVPANVLPASVAETLLGSSSGSIIAGISYFWLNGDRALALLILAASVIMPLFKIISLGLLFASVQFGSRALLRQKTRLFQVIERWGRWSMLDVYAVVLMATFVQAGRIVSITPGPGIVLFLTSVALTMLAAHLFDPRLLWDRPENHESESDVRT